MDLPIFAVLAQDGITNGAVYALLALALVLVFAVTCDLDTLRRICRVWNADTRGNAAR